jgi:hypothetical protein
VESVGSEEGPVAGSCEYGDEPSGSGATKFVSSRGQIKFEFIKSLVCNFCIFEARL